MKFVLKRNWANHSKGDIINISEHLGARLTRWHTARPYDEKKDGDKPSAKTKQTNQAPRDKMVRGAAINK